MPAGGRGAHSRYAAAITSGDVEAYLALFTDDAVVMPLVGGTFEGADAIRRFFEATAPVPSMVLRSVRAERIGDVIVNFGRLSVRLPEAAGGQEREGEFVAIAREENGALLIHRLATFPARRPPQ